VYRFALYGLGLLEWPLELVSYTVLVIQVGGFAWFTIVASGRIADAIAEQQRASKGTRFAEAALLRILFRLASIFVLAYLAIYAAEALSVPIAPLIAGLSVGGLAVALAIRPTLENVVGGLTLFADRPVRVGDFCRYGSEIGTVEEIGLRSTRIRSLERTLVTIPNSTFAHMELDNFSVRDQRLLKTILQLRYETTPKQLRYVLKELRIMLLAHPKVTEAPARVRFVGYGAYSLDLEVFAYLRCQDQDTFLAIQEDILLRVADIIETAGTSFAYPSQTLYYSRDRGLDAERAKSAEGQVDEMRVRRKLPFPDFDDEEREELEDTLDYPPAGSPHHQPRSGPAAAVADHPSAEPRTPDEPKTTPLWPRLLAKLK
jgi:MscS family membrane protein